MEKIKTFLHYLYFSALFAKDCELLGITLYTQSERVMYDVTLNPLMYHKFIHY